MDQLSLDAIAQALPEAVKLQATILGIMLATLWGLELVDTLLLRGALNQFGIRPRQLRGLPGILFAPLLHGNLKHLAANTGPLLVLSWLIMLRSLVDFALVTALGWGISGMGVWLFGGPRTNHLGASGVVFSYFGFLLLRAYWERSPVAIGMAVVTGLLYSGMIWGVLPIRRGQSWQSHLFGLVGGGLAAGWLGQAI